MVVEQCLPAESDFNTLHETMLRQLKCTKSKKNFNMNAHYNT